MLGETGERLDLCFGSRGTGHDVEKRALFHGFHTARILLHIRRFSVGEHKKQRHPVAFPFGRTGTQFFVVTLAQQLQRAPQEGGAGFGTLDVGDLQSGQFRQRQHLLHAAIEGDDADANGFQGEGVHTQRSDHVGQSDFDGLDGFAAHGAARVDEDVNGQSSTHGKRINEWQPMRRCHSFLL